MCMIIGRFYVNWYEIEVSDDDLFLEIEMRLSDVYVFESTSELRLDF
jgi:hypothetical protein